MSMAEAQVPLTIGTTVLPDVQWTWGVPRPPAREDAKGAAMSVEVPAVVELLRLIADQKVTASAAADAVEHLADRIDQRLAAQLTLPEDY